MLSMAQVGALVALNREEAIRELEEVTEEAAPDRRPIQIRKCDSRCVRQRSACSVSQARCHLVLSRSAFFLPDGAQEEA
jgi:hypothetical protein